ncbi:MAG: LamG domain-containing protein, partial [Bacteroidetes bacterium]
TATCSFDVTVTGLAPDITCPNAITVNNDQGQCGAIVTYAATETTAIPPSVITYDINPGSFFNVGTTTVTATATNPVGSDQCSFTVTVVDNEKPDAMCKDITIQLSSAGSASITTADVDNGSTDNCGISGMTVSPSSFGCANVGNNTVTLTVTDIHNNVGTCTAVVTVEDNVAPIAICQDVTVQLGTSGTGTITANDVDNGSNDACGIASMTLNNSSFDCADIQSTCDKNALDFPGTADEVRIGNLGNVQDWTIEFWFKTVGNINYQNLFHTQALQGNNGVRLELSSNYPAGHLYYFINGGGHTVVPLSGTLTSGVWHHLAIVGDKTNNSTKAYLDGVLVTNDVHTNWPASFSDFTIARGFSASAERDFNGSIDEFRIWNVARTQAEILAAMNMPLSGSETNLAHYYPMNEGSGTLVADQAGNKDGQLLNANASTAWVEGPAPVNPCNIVTLTVTDNNGNSNTCTANVTVEDNVNPTAICQNITVQLDANGNASITAAQVNNGSYDNCGIASLAVSPSSFGCSNVGGNTTTLTVTDVNGNVNTCTATISLQDNVMPVALCQDI